MKKIILLLFFQLSAFSLFAQINTDRVLAIGRNALYFEDYVLSIQYFNQVIRSKPWLAEPYFFRAIAKLNLDDYKGTEEDCTLCLERNAFYVQAYFARGIALHNQERFDEAVEDYKKALKLRPDERSVLTNLSIAYVQQKDFEKAEETLNYLIKAYPSVSNSYVSRAAMYVESGDTISAMQDYDKAIELDPYYAPVYASRAVVYLDQEKYDEALRDFDEAIRLDPLQNAFYINRGLVRYNVNDLRGAMADYDRVIKSDPNSLVARFNRGLLRMQVGDNNRAIEDFDVVLMLEPDNFFAYYNRAILNTDVGNLQAAIEDYTTVLEEYPNFTPAYYARGDVKRKMGDAKGADTDYWAAVDIEERVRKERQESSGANLLAENTSEDKQASEASSTKENTNTREQSDKNITKFNRLVVYDEKDTYKSKYQSEIRGRVQDKNVSIDLEPQFVLTYYEQQSQLNKTIYYNKTISTYNERMALNYRLLITNKESSLIENQVQMHFKSIDDYSGKLSAEPTNPDFYFGRGMDQMLVQDFAEAISDFTKVIELDPNYIFAYFNRAVLRYKQLEYEASTSTASGNVYEQMNKTQHGVTNFNMPGSSGIKLNSGMNYQLKESKHAMEHEQIMRDYDKVLQLNSDFVFAYFNRANIRCLQRDFRAAILDYDEAIFREPEFAEAYFNRGLAKLSLGDVSGGIVDLSKSGELGMINAYNIIKRMTNTSGN